MNVEKNVNLNLFVVIYVKNIVTIISIKIFVDNYVIKKSQIVIIYAKKFVIKVTVIFNVLNKLKNIVIAKESNEYKNAAIFQI